MDYSTWSLIAVEHNLCTWEDGTWQAEVMMHIFLVQDYYADDNQTNSYKQEYNAWK